MFSFSQKFGLFLEISLLLWQGSIVNVILNALSFIEFLFIILISFSQSMRTAFKKSMAFFLLKNCDIFVTRLFPAFFKLKTQPSFEPIAIIKDTPNLTVTFL